MQKSLEEMVGLAESFDVRSAEALMPFADQVESVL